MSASLKQLQDSGVAVWTKVATINFGDISVASPSAQVVVHSLPAYGYICDSAIVTNTAFTGGAMGDVFATIGTVADPDGYSGAVDQYEISVVGSLVHSVIGGMQSISAPTDIIVEVTGDADLDELTAGSADVWLCLAQLNP